MEIKATIAGTLRQWYCDVGDVVAADEALVAIEAGEVDVDLVAPVAGRVTEMLVLSGDTITRGDMLARIEPAAQSIGSLLDEPERKPVRKKQSDTAGRSSSRRALVLVAMLMVVVLVGMSAALLIFPVRTELNNEVNISFPAIVSTSEIVDLPLGTVPTGTIDALTGRFWDWGIPVQLVETVGNLPIGSKVSILSAEYDDITDSYSYVVFSVATGEYLKVAESMLAPLSTPSQVPTMVYDYQQWAWFYPLELKVAVADFPAGTAVQIIDASFDGNSWQVQIVTESGTQLNVRENQLKRPTIVPDNPRMTPTAGFANHVNFPGYPLLTTEQVAHIPAETAVKILDLQAGFGEWVYRIVTMNDQRVVTAHESQLQVKEEWTGLPTPEPPPGYSG